MNLRYGWLVLLFLCLGLNAKEVNDDPTPSVEKGAEVYASRCVLCHGSQAMGEGVLPLKLGSYPDTNLRTARKASSREAIQKTIIYGGMQKGISEFMPPFGKELTWTELESVTDFVGLIRQESKQALALINANMSTKGSSKYAGEHIFETRCVLCHGKHGEGDGRMSKLLKAPPPANLTLSQLPDDYLIKIIREGGQAMGRSEHMPPWKDQLNDKEIADLIIFVKSIRSHK